MKLEEAIRFVKDQSIVDIISQYVSIKKSGASYVSVCPFHNDKNPSMHISAPKGIFKCFSCGASGDSIEFVKRFNGFEFKETISEICRSFSINVDFTQTEEKRDYLSVEKSVVKMAVDFYQKLTKNSSIFSSFCGQRNFSKEIVDKFQLGICPGFDNFSKVLTSKKDPSLVKAALKIGLIKKSKKENSRGFYDSFHHRVVIPIFNQFHEPVGFSGRVFNPDYNPKYLNSPESDLFKKSELAFGYNFAKYAIRKTNKIIIVEGHLDVIALHDKGFDYSVASMGTALSPYLAKVFSNLNSKIYLALDSDEAGRKAALKFQELFLKNKVIPFYLSFSPHKDPDEFLRSKGKQVFIDLIEHSRLFLDGQVDHLQRFSDDTPQKKIELLYKFLGTLKPLGQDILAENYAAKAGEVLQLVQTPQQIIQIYHEMLVTPEFKVKKTPKKPEKVQEQKREKEGAVLSKLDRSFIRDIVLDPQLLVNNKLKNFLASLEENEVKLTVGWLQELFDEGGEENFYALLKETLSTSSINAKTRELLHQMLFDIDSSQIKAHNIDNLEKRASRFLESFTERYTKQRLLAEKVKLLSSEEVKQGKPEALKMLQEIQRKLYQSNKKSNSEEIQ